ncbi:MAG: serine/threonine-protein kinase [Kofleriaceae bacterium]
MTAASAPAAKTIGRYRVLGPLGAGAMGDVVRALDERLGREVAIKRVKNVHGVAAAIFAARFEGEGRALAALSHPGVVQVFDLGIDDDGPYLVMELLAGPSLKEHLAIHGARPPAEVVALGIQLARALEAAHARGILHRDLKPANVVRAADGTWKLVDFGVAHTPESDVTLAGQFVGTPSYAAPEALTLGLFSAASDVYGLAATLVEVATGRRPRGDLTLAGVIAASDQPLLDDELRASLGPLRDALAPALAIAAGARPDAAGLAARLAMTPTTAPSSVAPTSPGPSSPGMASVTAPLAVAAVATVALPDDATSAGGPRPWRWVGLGLAAAIVVGLLGLGVSSGGGGRAGGGGPAALPALPGAAAAPIRFDAPAGLDGKGAKDWAKIADKVQRGELGEALAKLREFERKRGTSSETTRLRAWLERQGGGRDERD